MRSPNGEVPGGGYEPGVAETLVSAILFCRLPSSVFSRQAGHGSAVIRFSRCLEIALIEPIDYQRNQAEVRNSIRGVREFYILFLIWRASAFVSAIAGLKKRWGTAPLKWRPDTNHFCDGVYLCDRVWLRDGV
jgi:hypothetical protein